MTKEIRKETTFFGTPIDVVYENGEKIAEVRHETTFFGNPVDRTYSPDGNKISETRHEETILGTPVRRVYGKGLGNSGGTLSPSTTDGSESNSESSLGISSGRRDQETNNLSGTSYSSSYSKGESTGSGGALVVILGIAGIAGLIGLLSTNKEKFIPKYHNLAENGIEYNYTKGQPLQPRHKGTISFNESELEKMVAEQNKYYRGDIGLEFKYELNTSTTNISIPIQIPDEQITRFEKRKIGKEKKMVVVEGELAKSLDLNEDRVLNLEELAVFYDFVGNGLNKNLHDEGYYELVNYFGIKTSDVLKKEITIKANDWLRTNFLPFYIENTMPEVKNNNSLSSVRESIGSIQNRHFSFGYSNSSNFNSETNYFSVSNLYLFYPLSLDRDNLTLTVNIPNELLIGNLPDGSLKRPNREAVEPPFAKRIDSDNNRLYSMHEITKFYANMGQEVEDYLDSKGYLKNKFNIGTALFTSLKPSYAFSRRTPGYIVYKPFLKNSPVLQKDLNLNKEKINNILISNYLIHH